MLIGRKRLTIGIVIVIALMAGTIFVASGASDGNPWSRVWSAIFGLQDRVETLESQAPLPQGFINAPAYDSGWIALPENLWIVIQHDLNTTDLLVYVLVNYANTIDQSWVYSQDVFWYIHSENELWIRTGIDVHTTPFQVRVRLWKIAQP